MAFTPKTWVTGDVLASVEMNRVETGIDDAHSLVATAQSEIDAHEALTNNPHSVTATQIGAANILTQLKAVDGAGSGLDADTVDGHTIYAGQVDSDGTAINLPSGWTSSYSVPDYTVTHSLGGSVLGNDYVVTAAPVAPYSAGNSGRLAYRTVLNRDSFTIRFYDVDGSERAATFGFILVKI
jgi:hypothetical protein